jgi:hypothetical protein
LFAVVHRSQLENATDGDVTEPENDSEDEEEDSSDDANGESE